MFATAHGGGCCGVSHIYGFAQSPGYQLSPLTPEGQYHSPTILRLNAPKEPALIRLKRLIKLIESRPQGCIEVVLAPQPVTVWPLETPVAEKFNGTEGYQTQIEVWEKHLFKLGFEHVKTFKNSNTQRMLRFYMRISGSPEAPPITDKDLVTPPDPAEVAKIAAEKAKTAAFGAELKRRQSSFPSPAAPKRPTRSTTLMPPPRRT